MFESFRNLSLGTLLDRLHSSLRFLAHEAESAFEKNKSISSDEIGKLRDHIQLRLNNEEDIEDNKKVLALLELFSNDKKVLEMLHQDAGEWLRLLNAIEANLATRTGALTEQEKEEITRIHELTSDVRAYLRK